MTRGLTAQEKAKLDKLASKEFERIRKMSPEEVDAELRRLGADQEKNPAWRKRALEFLEGEIRKQQG